ncbi:MAG: hypothetical protein F4077_10385 [Gammaproteobacteria bacterium]|nr:hypothetical protein [Gammaproteobacteria bacterium]MYI78135.1 hypothetical protein [Gammaproteobacteria bacterium]
MKHIKIFAVSSLASLFALSALTQNADETDATTSSGESLTKLEKAQADTDENEFPDVSLETMDELVESMVGATVSIFNLTFAGTDSPFDEAIEEMEKNWAAKVEKFDTDKNGSLSLSELENVPEEEWADDYKALSDEERDEALRSQFKELDTDENGEITGEEVVELVKKEVETLKELIESLELSPLTEPEEDASDTVE